MSNVVLLLLGLLLCPPLAWSQAQQYDRAAPSLKGLVAWYLGRPGFVWGPQLYDVAGRFHGTRTGGAAWAVSTRQGNLYDIQFDGTNDYVTVPAHAALEPPERTVMVWITPTSGGSAYQALWGNQHATHYFNVFYRPATSKLAIYYKTTGADQSLDLGSGLSITANTRTHIAATLSSTLLTLYVNCKVSDTQTALGTLVASNTAFLMGASNSPIDNWFSGTESDLRVYNRALTQVEVCAAMRQPVTSLFLTASAQESGFVQALLKSLFFHFMRKQ